MHAAIVHFAPILGAEKSKTPFYIAGGLLVAWALFVSLGIGLRVRGFPGSAGAQRAVMAVTVLLVIAAASAAILTSGGSSAAGVAGAASSNNSQTTAGGAPGNQLTESADPSGQLRYTKSKLEAKAGMVSIDFLNSSPLPHNMTIARGSTVLGATPTFNGGSRKLTLHLAPGTYKFYCSVPGHREAGMEGTLVVS